MSNPTELVQAFTEALESDHPCNEVSCDIAAAMEQGCIYSAFHLLTSATDELPELHTFFAAHPNFDTGRDLYNCPDWDEWLEFHRKHGRKCQACESYNYATVDYRDHEDWTPTSCGNCGATLFLYPTTVETWLEWLNEVTEDIAIQNRLDREYQSN